MTVIMTIASTVWRPIGGSVRIDHSEIGSDPIETKMAIGISAPFDQPVGFPVGHVWRSNIVPPEPHLFTLRCAKIHTESQSACFDGNLLNRGEFRASQVRKATPAPRVIH